LEDGGLSRASVSQGAHSHTHTLTHTHSLSPLSSISLALSRAFVCGWVGVPWGRAAVCGCGCGMHVRVPLAGAMSPTMPCAVTAVWKSARMRMRDEFLTTLTHTIPACGDAGRGVCPCARTTSRRSRGETSPAVPLGSWGVVMVMMQSVVGFHQVVHEACLHSRTAACRITITACIRSLLSHPVLLSCAPGFSVTESPVRTINLTQSHQVTKSPPPPPLNLVDASRGLPPGPHGNGDTRSGSHGHRRCASCRRGGRVRDKRNGSSGHGSGRQGQRR
jgi:hypothetical protein